MQQVSEEYKRSIKDSLRERSYIMVVFGLLNQEAQANASIDSGEFTYFSKEKSIFNNQSEPISYATLEENFTKVDGSMYFLPRENSPVSLIDTGLISKPLVSAGAYDVVITLHAEPIDFKGLTIDFGENYPVDFDVIGGAGQTIEVRGNTKWKWSTEDVIENTDSVTLRVYRMKNPDSRLRIYSFLFGYGLVYYNDSVMDSKLDSYVSPVGADVPQIDFSVTLSNYDKYFNVDNPESAVNFLETGQEMDVFYGYQLPGSNIEWIKGGHLYCSDWVADDYSATIRCQDIFRHMDAEYYKGTYSSAGISYYDLAERILADMGETRYYIDPRLKNLYTKNPLNRVKHKEALQIIANACRCILSQNRDGQILIKSNFIPDVNIESNGETTYSNVSNVLSDERKAEYASLATNYTTVDGKMYFLPRNHVGGLFTGFVSNNLSDAQGKFSVNPIITITQEAAFMYYGCTLVFGNALPGGITFRTYNNSELVEEWDFKGEITKTLSVLHEFVEFDVMEIEFTSTAEPFSRIVLDHFNFGDITEFVMTRNDMTSSPKAIKQELVKEIIVPCYSYQPGNVEDTLASEEIDLRAGEVITFFVDEASHDYSITVDDVSSGATILDSGSYFVTVQFSVSGKHNVSVLGYRYRITERYAVKELNPRGRTIKWGNPLISDMTMAVDLAEWLGEYYSVNVEYEYSNRGFPEIDVNDVIYQENEFVDGMKVNVYRESLTFKQALSGKITARRIGGQNELGNA